MKICISKLLCLKCTYAHIIHMYMFNSCYQELQPLFQIDPLLLRLFVKVTALEDIQLLISKVPTSILLMRLAEECTYGHQVKYIYMI